MGGTPAAARVLAGEGAAGAVTATAALTSRLDCDEFREVCRPLRELKERALQNRAGLE